MLTGDRLPEDALGTAVVSGRGARFTTFRHDFPACLLPPPGTAAALGNFLGVVVLLRSLAGERAGLEGAEERAVIILAVRRD